MIKKILLILRILIFIVIILLVFQPVKKVYKKRNIPTVIALIDDSQSMGYISQKGFEQIKSKVNLQLVKNNKVKPFFFAFSDNIRNVSEKEVESLKSKGKKTDITGALEKIKTDFIGKDIDSIILFSDGNQNINKDSKEVLSELGDLKIPVFAVIPEISNLQKNISIGNVEVPDIVFRNVNTTIVANINSTGFIGKKISIFLKTSNKIVLQTKILDIENNGVFEVPFEVIPEEAGSVSYVIEIPTYEGEKDFSDNKKKFVLNVEPEKIRILYLCGQPSFNYSFLRNTLKNNPNVELVSFVILRNPENVVAVSDNELSLIPFPVEEIFSREIFNFDLLIFDNFNFFKFPISTQYLMNIKNFVTEYGKALLIIGGEVPLDIYQNTPINEILPITPSSDISSAKYGLNVLHPEHGIMRLVDDPVSNDAIWKNMPELDSVNIAAVREKTIVLAETEKSKYPVITIKEKDKGRVMCILTPSMWRLALGSDNSYNYVKFFGQSIKWLTNAASMKQVAIIAKNNYNIGDIAKIKMRVKDEYFKPVDNAIVSVRIQTPDGKKESIAVPPGIENGEYEFSTEINLAGEYKLEAQAYYNKKFLGNDNISLNVFDVSKELESNFVNEPFMKEVADLTNGKFMSIEEFNFNKLEIKPRTTQSDLLYEINIWNKPIIYILLIILLSIEWFLRRRSGLQ
ncbi:MAG: hypothetical protein PHE88_04855 [Elusimicrobia bacterium]|nr:hypothetical protein [Elusimicrobiota bacterium]